MHLLIDVRTYNREDREHIFFARIWKDEWIRHHPHDKVTFLAFHGDPVDDEDVIHVTRSWYQRKKLASHEHGPDRIISFSRLPPIDTDIPTIAHIWDMAEFLYPREMLSFWEKKIRDFQRKKLLRHAHAIIVPHISVGLELSEMMDISEEKMYVIPYLSPPRAIPTLLPRVIHDIHGPYFVAPGTPGNEWNPTGLLQAFSRYIHDFSGTNLLVIHGEMGENLSYMTSLIRALDIGHFVKILHLSSPEEQKELYKNAQGWIWAGPYYSGGYSIALAESIGLPLLLSDITTLKEHTGMHVHPHHTEEITHALTQLGKSPISLDLPEKNDAIMQVYRRIIAEGNLQKKRRWIG